MKIQFEKVEAFKVKGKTREFTFFRVSMWNSLEEWRATTGEKLILGPAEVVGGFRGPFADVFNTWGGRPIQGESCVIMATPDLVEELTLQKVEPKVEPEKAA